MRRVRRASSLRHAATATAIGSCATSLRGLGLSERKAWIPIVRAAGSRRRCGQTDSRRRLWCEATLRGEGQGRYCSALLVPRSAINMIYYCLVAVYMLQLAVKFMSIPSRRLPTTLPFDPSCAPGYLLLGSEPTSFLIHRRRGLPTWWCWDGYGLPLLSFRGASS